MGRRNREHVGGWIADGADVAGVEVETVRDYERGTGSDAEEVQEIPETWTWQTIDYHCSDYVDCVDCVQTLTWTYSCSYSQIRL
jgi:hypothetical protein